MTKIVDYSKDIQKYCEGVLSGEIVAGKYVKLAVQRHLDDLEHAGERGYYFNADYANRAINFFPLILRHSTGEWENQPFHLTSFQKFCVWCIFGWRKLEDDFRRFRKVYITIARKNGKTTLAAGLALLLMNADIPREPRAEIYSAATKEDQAKLVYREASDMVKKAGSKRFRDSIKEYTGRHRLVKESDQSFFRPLGSDSNSTDGLNPHGVFKDELHAWGERHRGLHEKLSTGGGSRRQPLEVIITTAGDDNSQIWIEEDEYACRVLENAANGDQIDDRLFAYIARLDKDDDIFDPAVWPKANPNLGESFYPEYLEVQANEAKNRPEKKNEFSRYHANIRVASKEQAIGSEEWAACRGELSDLQGRVAYGSWDLGRSNDWASISLVFPIREENRDGQETVRWEHKSWAWTCSESPLEVWKPPYQQWVDEGWLTVHEGDAVDFGEIKRFILDLSVQYHVASWAYDPTFSQQLAQELLNDHGFEIYPFAQTAAKYNEPIRRFIEAVAKGLVTHEGNPCFSWQLMNLQIKRNTQDWWMPDKSDRTRKIDGPVSTLMAFSEAIYAENFTSVYQSRGILEFDSEGNQVDHLAVESIGGDPQQIQDALDLLEDDNFWN